MCVYFLFDLFLRLDLKCKLPQCHFHVCGFFLPFIFVPMVYSYLIKKCSSSWLETVFKRSQRTPQSIVNVK